MFGRPLSSLSHTRLLFHLHREAITLNRRPAKTCRRAPPQGKSQKELAKEAEDAKKAKRAASENKDEEEEDITKYQDHLLD